MRDRQKSNDLLKAFRESRQQIEKPVDNSVDNVDRFRRNRTSTFTRGYETRPKKSDPYSCFLEKYKRLSSTIDEFKTQDLMYFFREKAKENGVKYVIANTKRDMAIFKKLQDNYTPREICLMIEFIFCSPQNYLDKTATQPTVLASSWCNTIYRDSLLWADDAYEPSVKTTSKKERIKKREWQREVTDEKATIGEWE